MADDINAGRRAELLAQKAALEPVIRGLHDDSLTIISPELKSKFDAQIVFYETRRSLIDDEISGMDATNAQHGALLAHGYPELPKVTLETRLWEELQRENADRTAAASIFEEHLSVDFNPSVSTTDVPQPVPTATAALPSR
jgi:hypothetical protein